MTGMEIQLEDAFILDRREAHQALRDLRGKLKALEHLVAELGQYERVEMPDQRNGKTFTRLDSRLVCQDIAQALSAIWPEKKLFVSWPEWKARREAFFRALRKPEKGDESEHDPPREVAHHEPDA